MKHVITIGCLASAVVLYFAGLETGAAVLFAASIVFELAFWKRVLK
ncbi:MAG: hypothetical protein ABI171_22485 [Collimonas sp.]